MCIRDRANNGCVELGIIRPFYQYNKIVADIAQKTIQRNTSQYLFEFDSISESYKHKQTAIKWLKSFHIETEPENIMLTAGTQNALTIVFLALFHSGDKILTDSYTYSNFIGLARQLNVQLISVAADEDGMIPDLVEKQCRIMDIKGIFLMPVSYTHLWIYRTSLSACNGRYAQGISGWRGYCLSLIHILTMIIKTRNPTVSPIKSRYFLIMQRRTVMQILCFLWMMESAARPSKDRILCVWSVWRKTVKSAR